MTYILNIDSKANTIERYWEMCVGSCHAATALREDYRIQLARCARELGFRYVRFHGIFDDDMSVMKKPPFREGYKLSFSNIDSIFDFFAENRHETLRRAQLYARLPEIGRADHFPL